VVTPSILRVSFLVIYNFKQVPEIIHQPHFSEAQLIAFSTELRFCLNYYALVTSA
jgi:hypothetical protein